MKGLVTTALELPYESAESVLYLGEWCRLYGAERFGGDRSYTVVPNHWDDRKKFKKDYKYLKDLHEALLISLAQLLNEFHQIEQPLRYWRIILDPWLVSYVAVIFDRWECLRSAFESYQEPFFTYAYSTAAEACPSIDSFHFQELIQTDCWNHHLFLQIIESVYSKNCEIRKVSSACAPPIKASLPLKPRSFKRKIVEFADTLLAKLAIRKQIVIYQSYFPPAALLKLNLSFRQWPRLYLKEFESFLDLTAVPVSRNRLILPGKAEGAFESFLFARILQDLPVCYLEGFALLQARVGEITLKPSLVLTANANWFNEVFKFWLAEQVLRGCKFVSVQHGGSITQGTLAQFEFEEESADYFATWTIPCHPKHVRLPPTKFIGFKPKLRRTSYCSLIGLEMPRYVFRAQVNPGSGQVLKHYAQAIAFYEALNSSIQMNFRVKPFPEQGWNFKQRFIDDLGSDKIYEGLSFSEVLALSRLVVCTYPETTFSEAMASDLPTIMLYPDCFWELHPSLQSLLQTLKEAKIVFHDPQAAADHVNSIWHDTDHWWNSPDVISARSEFHKQALKLGSDWLDEWRSFIESILPKA